MVVKKPVDLMLGLLLCLPWLVNAMEVKDIYKVTMMVESNSKLERQEHMANGMAQVIKKVCPDNNALDNPVLKMAIENPSDYVEKYSFSAPDLNITYNSKEINKLLIGAKLPVWGEQRPLVLGWIALDSQQDRRLISAESHQNIMHSLDLAAKERGLPILLPLLDLEDVTNVTVTDVWGQFPSVLQKASTRYDSDAILVGRISERSQWQSKWQLLVGNEAYEWSLEGESLDTLLQETVHIAADKLGLIYAISHDEKTANKHFTIGIEDVSKVSDYAKLSDYLEGLDPVSKVEIMTIGDKKTVFKVYPKNKNGANALKQAINLEQRLVPSQLAQTNEQLNYRWVR